MDYILFMTGVLLFAFGLILRWIRMDLEFNLKCHREWNEKIDKLEDSQ